MSFQKGLNFGQELFKSAVSDSVDRLSACFFALHAII